MSKTVSQLVSEMARWVAIDFDGTLLRNGEEEDIALWKPVIREFQKAGLEVVIVTLRAGLAPDMKRYIQLLQDGGERSSTSAQGSSPRCPLPSS